MTDCASHLKVWEKLSGYSRRKVLKRGRRLDLVGYEFPAPNETLKGRKIVFFSDLHVPYLSIRFEELKNMISEENPDWLVFGGDLASYSCWLDTAMEKIATFPAKSARMAVLGNWDKKRRRWFPNFLWKQYYKHSGYWLLANSGIIADGLFFYGSDDFKLGLPRLSPAPPDLPGVLVCHNPDTVADYGDDATLRNYALALCGHTHGGQIRIPFVGALKTSSRYWRKFDYGLYRHRHTGTFMVVSSGLGTTALPLRFICRPEIVTIKFT